MTHFHQFQCHTIASTVFDRYVMFQIINYFYHGDENIKYGYENKMKNI